MLLNSKLFPPSKVWVKKSTFNFSEEEPRTLNESNKLVSIDAFIDSPNYYYYNQERKPNKIL